MSFSKYVFCAFIAWGVFGVYPLHESDAAGRERTIALKVVIDQYFIRNFNVIRVKEPLILESAKTPEDFVNVVMERLSARYRKERIGFSVKAVERIVLPERVMFNTAYVGILDHTTCFRVELVVGLSGGAFISTSGGNDGAVAVGSADRDTGRLFAEFGLLGIIMDPAKDVVHMVDTLDHEMQHMFGASHKEEGVLTDAERKIFLNEGRAAIRKNRMKKFSCVEPKASS